jgi:hypothetical protein
VAEDSGNEAVQRCRRPRQRREHFRVEAALFLRVSAHTRSRWPALSLPIGSGLLPIATDRDEHQCRLAGLVRAIKEYPVALVRGAALQPSELAFSAKRRVSHTIVEALTITSDASEEIDNGSSPLRSAPTSTATP